MRKWPFQKPLTTKEKKENNERKWKKHEKGSGKKIGRKEGNIENRKKKDFNFLYFKQVYNKVLHTCQNIIGTS